MPPKSFGALSFREKEPVASVLVARTHEPGADRLRLRAVPSRAGADRRKPVARGSVPDPEVEPAVPLDEKGRARRAQVLEGDGQDEDGGGGRDADDSIPSPSRTRSARQRGLAAAQKHRTDRHRQQEHRRRADERREPDPYAGGDGVEERRRTLRRETQESRGEQHEKETLGEERDVDERDRPFDREQESREEARFPTEELPADPRGEHASDRTQSRLDDRSGVERSA